MKVRIGGVPEHFNLPWQLALEDGAFKQGGIDLVWQVYPGGTGAMHNALKYDQLDLAILLTEGFIAAVSSGLEARIVKQYIDSPLQWGIYSGVNSGINPFLRNGKERYAISRLGSGSHLMPQIHAQQESVHINENQFIVVDDLHNAITSLNRNETQFFYWEKYTSLPFVKSNQLKMVSEFSAPWSSFLIAGNTSFVKQYSAELKKTFDIIDAYTQKAKADKSFIDEVCKRFTLTHAEAVEWLENVVWHTGTDLNDCLLANATTALKNTGIINNLINPVAYLHTL